MHGSPEWDDMTSSASVPLSLAQGVRLTTILRDTRRDVTGGSAELDVGAGGGPGTSFADRAVES